MRATVGINNEGTIVATVFNSTGGHGVLFQSGHFGRFFEDPLAQRAPGQGTWAISVNDGGAVAGQHFDSGGVVHGFTFRHGRFVTVNDPNGVSTSIQSIADDGEMVGYYTDAGGTTHGLIFTP